MTQEPAIAAMRDASKEHVMLRPHPLLLSFTMSLAVLPSCGGKTGATDIEDAAHAGDASLDAPSTVADAATDPCASFVAPSPAKTGCPTAEGAAGGTIEPGDYVLDELVVASSACGANRYAVGRMHVEGNEVRIAEIVGVLGSTAASPTDMCRARVGAVVGSAIVVGGSSYPFTAAGDVVTVFEGAGSFESHDVFRRVP